MRIISQNKDLSIDFHHTPICVSYNHVCAIMDGQQKVIGKYETDERAKEVFEEIHIAYSGMPMILKNIEPAENIEEVLKKANLQVVYTVTEDRQTDIEYIDNGVYRMPAQ